MCFLFSENRTHDTITHHVAARGQPARHRWGLHERAELRIAKQELGRDGRTVRGVARGHRSIVVARDNLLYRAPHTVRSDDNVSMDDLARGERDVRPALDGRVGLHVANGGAEADMDAGGGARETEEEGMVVGAVDLVVGCAVIEGHVPSPAGVPNALACVVAAEDERFGQHACGGESGAEAPADNEPRLVRRELDASADVAEDGGGLEDYYAVAGVREGVGGGETTEAGADDDDIEGECRTATVIKWWDLLDGGIPSELRRGSQDALHCGSVNCGKRRGRE